MAAPDPSVVNPWLRLHLRYSALTPTTMEEAAVAGQYLNERVTLTESVPPGRYLYVVDEQGAIWLGSIAGIIRTEGNPSLEWEIRHSSLVPVGEPVRAAGMLVLDHRGNAAVNSASGLLWLTIPCLELRRRAGGIQ